MPRMFPVMRRKRPVPNGLPARRDTWLVLALAGSAALHEGGLAAAGFKGPGTGEYWLAVAMDAAVSVGLVWSLFDTQRRPRLGGCLALLLVLGLQAAAWARTVAMGPPQPADLLLLPALIRLTTGAGKLLLIGAVTAFAAVAVGLVLNAGRPRWRWLVPPLATAGLVAFVVGVCPESPRAVILARYKYVGHWAAFAYAVMDRLRADRIVARADPAAAPVAGFADAALGSPTRNIHILLLESFRRPAAAGIDDVALDPRFRRWLDKSGSRALSPVIGGRTTDAQFELSCGLPGVIGPGQIMHWRLRGEPACLPRRLAARGWYTRVSNLDPAGAFRLDDPLARVGWLDRRYRPHFMEGQPPAGPVPARRSLATEERALRPPGRAGTPFLHLHLPGQGHLPWPEVEAAPGSPRAWAQSVARVSRAVADHVAGVLAWDPRAVVLIVGDHTPPLGGAVRRAAPAGTEGRAAMRRWLHRVPVVLLKGGRVVSLPRWTAHWELPYYVMDAATDGAFCRDNACPSREAPLLRPLRRATLTVDRATGRARLLPPGASAAAAGLRARTARAAHLAAAD